MVGWGCDQAINLPRPTPVKKPRKNSAAAAAAASASAAGGGSSGTPSRAATPKAPPKPRGRRGARAITNPTESLLTATAIPNVTAEEPVSIDVSSIVAASSSGVVVAARPAVAALTVVALRQLEETRSAASLVGPARSMPSFAFGGTDRVGVRVAEESEPESDTDDLMRDLEFSMEVETLEEE